MQLKFGKKPARKGAMKLQFGSFVNRAAIDLPKHPTGPFGHDRSILPNDWGMLANDKWSCCVWSGAAHETKMIAGMAGKQLWFPDKAVLGDYAASTGFKFTDQTDNGTDMVDAAKYRMNTGIADGHGGRHKIIGYAEIEAGNLDLLLVAVYLFGAVGIGVSVPQYMMDQFDAKEPFHYVQGGNNKLVGGHYLPAAGSRDPSSQVQVITWGADYRMDKSFLENFNDESIVYFSAEGLKERRSPEGFDYDALLANLNKIRHP